MRVIDLQRVCSVVGQMERKLPSHFSREILEKEIQSPLPSLEQIHNPWQVGWGDEYPNIQVRFCGGEPVWSFLEVVWSQKQVLDRPCADSFFCSGLGQVHLATTEQRSWSFRTALWQLLSGLNTSGGFWSCPSLSEKKSSEDWSCSLQEGDILGLLASNWVVICYPETFSPFQSSRTFWSVTSFKTCFYTFFSRLVIMSVWLSLVTTEFPVSISIFLVRPCQVELWYSLWMAWENWW